MPYVVTEACIRCTFMDCVEACPTHAFHAGPNFLVINPAVCANCGLCEMVCPVQAVYPARDLPEHLKHYAALNAELCGVWPAIAVKGEPPADAEHWAEVEGKGDFLEK